MTHLPDQTTKEFIMKKEERHPKGRALMLSLIALGTAFVLFAGIVKLTVRPPELNWEDGSGA